MADEFKVELVLNILSIFLLLIRFSTSGQCSVTTLTSVKFNLGQTWGSIFSTSGQCSVTTLTSVKFNLGQTWGSIFSTSGQCSVTTLTSVESNAGQMWGSIHPPKVLYVYFAACFAGARVKLGVYVRVVAQVHFLQYGR
ncbi:uncharacterized protein MELLADRAFT_106933 [Melampsora larici-populina 98AG31]|uniref:Secreted protein n=1 Tax=Melampsora larici-populina (strain 98AG31 / pathotype 3-4-7) TaxID=747676 RepID=F4RN42_MELLP|nr:uncharacterized protein MELLADRAFT_106933 [Melampsora larici-populina 98AG31]EGG06233.1 hypothetical protein MELLADRAFT_106933 [Melampsora larici-populina 98AG31]